MVEGTIKRLKELKEKSDTSTWFKDHMNVFTDTSLHGSKKIVVKNEEKVSFLQRVYRPYIQSVIDHINARVESTHFILSMSVFDPCHLPRKKTYPPMVWKR